MDSNFLTSRKFRVRLNSSYSAWDDVTSGIPQGSVLGPVLFLIYINDLVESCDGYSEIYLFADDAKLFRHIKNASDNSSLQKAIDCSRSEMNICAHYFMTALTDHLKNNVDIQLQSRLTGPARVHDERAPSL